MSALSGDLLLSFMDATASLRAKGPPVQAWLRARVMARSGNRCWQCGQAASAVIPLFSPAMGGQKSDHNLAAACPVCRVRLLDQDPLAVSWETGEPLAEGRVAQRLDALTATAQHAVPASAQRSVALCTDWLSTHRWPFPRVPVSVLHGHEETWLTPIAATPGTAWASLAMAARVAGAHPVKMLPSVLLLDSVAWEPLAWTLIERGALLRRVHVAGVAEPEETVANGPGKPCWPGRWEELFHGVQQTARGRVAKPRTGLGHRAGPA